jgi:lambda family phage portal protein
MANRSYDAAATTRHNSNHWLFADNRDADSTIFQDLPTLRNRTRYECRNSCYFAGIADTLANDIVGTGPTPQLDSKNENINEIEDKFTEWMLNCDFEGSESLGDLLRLVGGMQQCESGEGLLAFKNLITTSPREVALRLLAIEPDRLVTPWIMAGAAMINNKFRDGIEFDDNGRPAFYYILKTHPGNMLSIGNITDFDKVPADQIIHLYRKNRPGQSRGVPWLAPALPLGAIIRRFTLATAEGAEQAANSSGILKTDTDKDDEDKYLAGEEIEIPRNSWLTISKDSDLTQVKPEHPATTYEMFKNQIINEIARCINMPFNVAACNSADYNYASGRLDWQTYYRFVGVIRRWIENKALIRIFRVWYREALLVRGYLKYATNDPIGLHWHWPGAKHVDPLKEANSQNVQIGDMMTTYSDEYAEKGQDWERQFKQIAKEKALMKELDLKPEDVSKALNDPNNNDEPPAKKQKGTKK